MKNYIPNTTIQIKLMSFSLEAMLNTKSFPWHISLKFSQQPNRNSQEKKKNKKQNPYLRNSISAL